MQISKPKLLVYIVSAVVATLVVVLLVVNFMPGEKRIERRLQRMYAVDDPRFMEELGVLLGPPVLGGNR